MRAPTEPFPVRFIRGDARGPGPTALRLALTPFSWLFGTAAEVRRALYQSGVFTVHRVPCPVVSVGNLGVGVDHGDGAGARRFRRDREVSGEQSDRAHGPRQPETPVVPDFRPHVR